jgi:hypothetical protein
MSVPIRLLVPCLLAVTFAACGPDGGATSTNELSSSTDELSSVIGAPCASSATCGKGQVCTTEDGVCNRPPGCRPGMICPTVCFGTCRAAAPTPTPCGPTTCAAGQVCCNKSCGICTPPGGFCTQQVCEPSTSPCKTDWDCRKFSDYCEGCNCRALSVCEKDPVCTGGLANCFVDPCFNKEAYCKAGTCALRAPTPTCAVERCGPPLGMPSRLCPDGKSVSGPTGRCLQQPSGACGWEIAACPDPSICPITTR